MPSKMQQQALIASALATVAAAIRLIRRRDLHTPPKPLPSDYPVAPADIVAAHERIAPHVHRTPVLTCQGLDALAGRSLKFKCEVFQRTGSFKIRGATNAALQAPADAPLVTHSSGNHAQALALAAQVTGREAHVIMPRTAPQVKRAAVAGYGAQITLCEPTNQARSEAAALKTTETRGCFVHPSNEPRVIAGQGTVALEFLDPCSSLDALVVPVGGGGLIAGIAVYAKWRRPSLKIIGAEPANVDDAFRSKRAGALLKHDDGDSVADGLKTLLGSNTWPVVRDLVDEIICVEEAEIKSATALVWGRMKLCIEPSAGVGVACVLSDVFRERYPVDAYKTVGVVLCGGNLDLAQASGKLFS